MNAATLTAIRARHNEGPDGDHVFLLACRLGHCGEAARLAVDAAAREVAANDPLRNHHDDVRTADRLIELVNATDADALADAAEVDLHILTQLHDDLASGPGGAEAFLTSALDGQYGEAAARAADHAVDAGDDDVAATARRVLELVAHLGASRGLTAIHS